MRQLPFGEWPPISGNSTPDISDITTEPYIKKVVTSNFTLSLHPGKSALMVTDENALPGT
jgi:hypothetical protein